MLEDFFTTHPRRSQNTRNHRTRTVGPPILQLSNPGPVHFHTEQHVRLLATIMAVLKPGSRNTYRLLLRKKQASCPFASCLATVTRHTFQSFSLARWAIQCILASSQNSLSPSLYTERPKHAQGGFCSFTSCVCLHLLPACRGAISHNPGREPKSHRKRFRQALAPRTVVPSRSPGLSAEVSGCPAPRSLSANDCAPKLERGCKICGPKPSNLRVAFTGLEPDRPCAHPF